MLKVAERTSAEKGAPPPDGEANGLVPSMVMTTSDVPDTPSRNEAIKDGSHDKWKV
jgi:hypothetical protein